MYQFIVTFENMDNEEDRKTLIKIEYFVSEAEAWEAAAREALRIKNLNEALVSISLLST